jgi:putative transposase
MKKSRFTETQIITILKEGEDGSKVKGICRAHAISDATYYNWKSKYGGMQVSDLSNNSNAKCLYQPNQVCTFPFIAFLFKQNPWYLCTL